MGIPQCQHIDPATDERCKADATLIVMIAQSTYSKEFAKTVESCSDCWIMFLSRHRMSFDYLPLTSITILPIKFLKYE